MKILLFGEFSGLFNCLRDGLVALGHDVFMFSDGDMGRQYPANYCYWKPRKCLGKLGHLVDCFNVVTHLRYLRGYDVVVFVSPRKFVFLPFFNKFIYNYMRKHNKTSYLCSSGLYDIAFRYWHEKKESKYHYYTTAILEGDETAPGFSYKAIAGHCEMEEELLKKITGIIPIWYEYAEPYRNFPNLKKTIRIPINTDRFEYTPNKIHDGKILFLLGKSRPSKGHKYIKAAFKRMQEMYSDRAEFVVLDKKLPFNDYMKLVTNANIIMDEAYSYSMAMNALFSMAKGKIIMGGAEPIGNKELGYEDNPAYNLCPDVDQICSCIEDVILHPDKLEERGLKSRQFVEKYHNYIDIAKEYVAIFEEDLNKLYK